MKTLFIICVFCKVLLFLEVAYAQDPLKMEKEQDSGNLTIVAVGDATIEKEKIAVLPIVVDGKVSAAENVLVDEFSNLIINDFAFYRKIFFIPNYKELKQYFDKPLNSVLSEIRPDYDFWSSKMASYLIQSFASIKNSQIEVNILAYDIKSKKEIYRNTVLLNQTNIRDDGHRISNEIYKLITGKDAIFNSKIVFVCDKSSNRLEPVKELYIMDFDGNRVKKLTNHNSTVFSPAISDDQKYVVYSMISKVKGMKNIDLYLMDLEKNTTVPISTLPGINSGAIFSPDGESIALTLSISGNADIYIMNLKNKNLKRLTSHTSDDVDPSFSPDGKTIAFLSGRPGRAMIYTLDISGEEVNVTRIGFVGKFNATPRFSPNGLEVVFSSWVDNAFDIYRMNTQGTELVRLTKDFGSNEDPSYSNDGQFITFSSKRVLTSTTVQQNVYIMDRDGEVLGSVTKNLGNCQTPRWSK